jgi:RNA polymerase sigma factor (sigma-70 family)
MTVGERNFPRRLPGQGACRGPDEGWSDRRLLERFTAGQDGEAFAVLVRRHGPTVFGVCRRVLGDRHDAEDASQVTFLVLARKAASLDRPELLAHWLYRVAYRTAAKARARAARRRESEKQAAFTQAMGAMPEEARRELRAVLDDELNRLPEKYRGPLVLCYLGGQTNGEAARLLGRPAGSMSGLLARGRALLRDRLGVTV